MKKKKKYQSEMQNIAITDNPLLDYINHQQMLKDNEVISDKEKEQMIQDEQIRIDNDIKGCYITFNFMF